MKYVGVRAADKWLGDLYCSEYCSIFSIRLRFSESQTECPLAVTFSLQVGL